MSAVDQVVQQVEQNLNSFVSTVSGLSEEVIRWKPSSEAWSIMEVLCHVEEAIPYWIEECRRVVASPGSEWGRNHLDEARLAAVAKADERSSKEVIENISHFKQLLPTLAAFTDSDLQQQSPSRNPRFGVQPVSFVIDHLLIQHLDIHTKQVQRNLNHYKAQ